MIARRRRCERQLVVNNCAADGWEFTSLWLKMTSKSRAVGVNFFGKAFSMERQASTDKISINLTACKAYLAFHPPCLDWLSPSPADLRHRSTGVALGVHGLSSPSAVKQHSSNMHF